MEHRLFTTRQFLADGHTEMELRWAVKRGDVMRVRRSVYARGTKPLNAFEIELAKAMAGDEPARGLVAARLHGLDGIWIPSRNKPLPRCRTELLVPEPVEVAGVSCVNGLQAVLDIAALVGPVVWEQALESGLHKKLFELEHLQALLPEMSRLRHHGTPLIRQVLSLRPPGAPPTESLLETLMVQLARDVPDVPEPTRQRVVENDHGEFVARVDLCWPEEGGFNEHDGEHHKGQPIYDANRQTEVTIVTGWLCGRFSWTEVRHNPVPTGRRLQQFIKKAKSRL